VKQKKIGDTKTREKEYGELMKMFIKNKSTVTHTKDFFSSFYCQKKLAALPEKNNEGE